MTDLEILIKFRQSEVNGYVTKLSKFTHECTSHCRTCLAQQACSAITRSGANQDFDDNYRRWASRTTFHKLPYLQQHYPEYFL